ncbi:MAG: transporter [Curvibacter sp. PD_MW3]|nr:MAG: transporter [Curvibacter sp. PD_MW3]
MKLWTLALAVTLALMGVNAEAKRLGGGTSVGKQSSNVTQRQAAPAAPAAPTQNAATAPKPAPAAAPAAAPKRPWGAMLGGLAAGLGLAWLAHSLGMGEAFGQFMLIGLVVLLAMMAFGWFMRNRRSAASSTGPYAFQGAGAGEAVTPSPAYRPENVGNDASARPWERNTASFDATGAQASPGIVIGSALAGSQAWGVPAGFDAEGFLKAAKTNFATLQAAWDRSDLGTLRSMMTDEMLAEIRQQLTEREAHTGGPANQTDVVMLEAQLLGIEDLGDTYMASVEFSGMIREEPSAGPSPFREVWNMTKSKTGVSGWLVAGVQALQ